MLNRDYKNANYLPTLSEIDATSSSQRSGAIVAMLV